MSKEFVDLNTPVIEMRDIVKKFGDFVANDGINLTVHKGEIHAILGENGAGKSTLMNQLYGLYKPTSGEIFVNGNRLDMSTPRDAIAAGIGMAVASGRDAIGVATTVISLVGLEVFGWFFHRHKAEVMEDDKDN